MIRNGAFGICFAALIQWMGCTAEDEEQTTCRIVFDYAYNDRGHIEALTLDENGDGSVDARLEYLNTYDDDGLISEVTTKCIRSDDKVKYETHHELNEFGRTVNSLYDGEEIKVYLHEYGESKSVEQRRFSYTAGYDDANRLVSETYDLEADGIPDEQELHTLDENGTLEKYEIDESADGTIDFTRYYSYTYTEQGLYESILWEDVGLITTITEFTYEYDEEGRLIGRAIDIRQDGIPDEECTTSYNDEGEEEFCETLVNGAPTTERTEWRDTEGNLVATLSEQVDDGAASRNTYTYDESGKRLTALSETRENSESSWEETVRSTYTYDDDGNKLSETKDIYNWGPSTQSCADSYLPSYQLTLSR